MKIALLCNTIAAFPLLDWLVSQGLLVGVGTKAQKSDFFDDLTIMCEQHKIEIHTFDKPNLTEQLIEFQKKTVADLILVLGFPYKIPTVALEKPPLGFYNIHFGQLPKYGGSFPVFWQIKNQEKSSALTIHKMDSTFDSGPIAIEIPLHIESCQCFGIVEINYGMLAVHATYQLIDKLLSGSLVLKPQAEHQVVYFPKPTLKDLIIVWQKMDANEVLALIKSCNPWSKGAIAQVNGLGIKIIDAQITVSKGENYGTIFNIHSFGMDVECANQTAITITVIHSQFGYFGGENLGNFGVKSGDVFQNIFI